MLAVSLELFVVKSCGCYLLLLFPGNMNVTTLVEGHLVDSSAAQYLKKILIMNEPSPSKNVSV